MAEKTKIIIINDPAKKRKKSKQLNFWIPIELALEFDELLVIEQRKQKRPIKKADMWVEVLAKGIRHWLNR